MTQYDANGEEIDGKYTEEEKQEYYRLIAQTAWLSAVVNQETDFCVFWEFSGHVNLVRISIRESKKRYEKELILTEFQTYFEKHYEYDKSSDWKLNDLRKKKAFLEYILNFHEIPYEKATSEIIEWTEKVWSF